MLRTIAITAATFAVILLGAAAEAQSLAPAGPGFQVESAPRPGGRPAVEGYVHNGRFAWLSDVRVRVEVLDADGITVAEAFGWAVGNLGPGGRGYFVVAVKRLGAAYPSECRVVQRGPSRRCLKVLTARTVDPIRPRQNGRVPRGSLTDVP